MTHSQTPLRHLLTVLLGLLLLPIATSAQAEDDLTPIELPQGNNHVQTFEKMRVLLSDGGQLDAGAALAKRDAFEPIATRWLDFGVQDGGVWVLMKVTNTSDRAGEWMLDIQRPFVDELFVAKVAGGSVAETLLEADASTTMGERPVVSPYWVAPVWMEAGESAEILVGVRSSSGSWMPLAFATPERMRTAHMQEARFNWIINGAIAVLIAAALAMGRLIGWRLTLSFAVYAALGALFVANNEGYLHRFIWPDAPGLFVPANFTLLPLMVAAGLEFARRFVDLATRHRRADRWITGFQILLLGLAVLALFGSQFALVQTAILAAVPIGGAAYLALGVIAWRAGVLGGRPFLAGAALLALTLAFMAWVLAVPGQLPLTVALDYFHATLLAESLAFFVAIVVRMLALQQELNRSLSAEIEASNAKLKLEENLRESRERYDAARGKAEQLKMRLASTSHDLQQPLLSLRQGLRDIVGPDAKAAGELAAALDYLEGVTESGLAGTAPDDLQAGEKPDEGAEVFPVSFVLDNCAAMFRAEAASQGVELQIEASDAKVRADPVALMRAVSNLVSNALKHAQASRITVSTRSAGDALIIQVSDDGVGMDEASLSDAMEPYSKGDSSAGHGLGLALVRSFASQPGHGFEAVSNAGEGTAISICVPMAE